MNTCYGITLLTEGQMVNWVLSIIGLNVTGSVNILVIDFSSYPVSKVNLEFVVFQLEDAN